MRHRQGRPAAAAASLHHHPGSFPSSFHSNSHLHSFQHGGVESCTDQSAGGGQQQQQQVCNADLEILRTSSWSPTSLTQLMHEQGNLHVVPNSNVQLGNRTHWAGLQVY